MIFSLDQSNNFTYKQPMKQKGIKDQRSISTNIPKPQTLQTNSQQLQEPGMLNLKTFLEGQLPQSPKENPYGQIKVLHGMKTDHFQNRIRWDENQLIREYFGADLADENQRLNNFELFPIRTPKQVHRSLQPIKCAISSVLEMNPEHFESSLQRCSRRFKAEKYNYLQKYLDENQWEKIFGKTQKMLQRERKVKLRQLKQQNQIKQQSPKQKPIDIFPTQNISLNSPINPSQTVQNSPERLILESLYVPKKLIWEAIKIPSTRLTKELSLMTPKKLTKEQIYISPRRLMK